MGTVLVKGGGGFWSEEGGFFGQKTPPRPEKKHLKKIIRFLSAVGKILTVF